MLNYRGIKLSGLFQDVMTFGLLAAFAIFTVLGFARGASANWQPWFSQPGSGGVWLSIFLVMQIVPYFMTGWESVAKGSEEARTGFDPRNFTKAMYARSSPAVFLRHHHRRRHLCLPVAGDRRRGTCARRLRSSARSDRTPSRS